MSGYGRSDARTDLFGVAEDTLESVTSVKNLLSKFVELSSLLLGLKVECLGSLCFQEHSFFVVTLLKLGSFHAELKFFDLLSLSLVCFFTGDLCSFARLIPLILGLFLEYLCLLLHLLLRELGLFGKGLDLLPSLPLLPLLHCLKLLVLQGCHLFPLVCLFLQQYKLRVDVFKLSLEHCKLCLSSLFLLTGTAGFQLVSASLLLLFVKLDHRGLDALQLIS